MFLTSSNRLLTRGLHFNLQPPKLQKRLTKRAPAHCISIEATSTERVSTFLKSSVVPARLPLLSPPSHSFPTQPPLAYEVLQGALVRHCDVVSSTPPTIVLVHGILGSKKNLHAFARRILEGYPSWQAILVDLRCHGDSQCQSLSDSGPHSVESAARDILQLLNYLKLFPRVLIGHSFGGKVVMSMAHQFGQRLPRPVQAWVLDALPGDASWMHSSQQDHPFDLIKTLQNISLPVPTRSSLIRHLTSHGFSPSVANWMTTNLKPREKEGFTFSFDLAGIEELYRSYETSSLWPLLHSPPEGLEIDFVRAERSHFRWTDQLQQQIESLGHRVHLLRDAGHWVHADNPEGLFQILKSSFGHDPFASATTNLSSSMN